MRSVFLKSWFLLVSLAIWAFGLPPVRGQDFLSPADSEWVAHYLDSNHSPDLLHCSIQFQKPTLDFAFRLEMSYIATCRFSIFEGRATKVMIVVRVTPEGGKSIILGEPYYLPEPNKDNELKQYVEMSGGFAVGEGHYQIEVLVADQRANRTSRKRWSTHVARPNRQGVSVVSVPAGTVIPIEERPRPIQMDTSGKGLRLTILLDAAPLNPRSPSLRAEDRAFLLGSLSSVLKQIPCASVRLRAFNLDQQRELFSQDQFDDAGFIKLARSMEDMELGTVSTKVLQQHHGAVEMLLDYANQELLAADPSDAVIILGPHTHYFAEIPRGMLKGRETPNPHFSYFEYFPGIFGRLENAGVLERRGVTRRGEFHEPDTLSSLTKRLEGTVYEISSPADLANSIHKMLARVQPRPEPPTAGDWPARAAPLP